MTWSAASLALAGLLLVLPASARAEEPKPLVNPAEMTTYWWTFLVSGENKTPLVKEEAQKMQQGHIANLERLGKEGKALTAGPFGDRTPLRGIVVLTVKTKAEAEAEFKEDPFVKAGYLKPEVHPWMTFKNSFGKPAEPFKMQQYQLVLYRKGPAFSEEDTPEGRTAHQAHLKHVLDARTQGFVALVGPLTDNGDRRGILVFRTEDAAKVKAFIEADPHVKAGRLVAEQHPLYLAAGVLDPKK